MSSVRNELRFALRFLGRTRAVTAAAILTLGLAIGANTAIFSAVRAVLLRPLPVRDPDRVVQLETDLVGTVVHSAGLRSTEIYDLMERRDLFDAVAGYLYRSISANQGAAGAASRVAVMPTLGPFFEVFDVRPQFGRLYDSTDVAIGNTRVVVLIACANIASLQLVRATARAQEFAVRMALGARRGAITRLAVLESVLLALAGGVLAVVVGWGVLRLIEHSDAARSAVGVGIRLDGPVFVFCAGATFVVTVAFGLAPVLHVGVVQPGDVMKRAARGASTDRASSRVPARRRRFPGGAHVRAPAGYRHRAP